MISKENLQEQLNQINAAITAIENGSQEYSINGRRFVRPDLKKLYDERAALNSQLIAEQNSGFGLKTYVARFDRR